MGSIGQAAAEHTNDVTGQVSMHPAAFSNAWAPDYRDRYVMMEMRNPSSCHGRSSPFNGDGYQQPPPVEVWRQRPDSDVMLPHYRILAAGNNNNINMSTGSTRGAAGAILGSTSESMFTRGSLQSPSAELYECNNSSTSVVSGDWQSFVDPGDAARYSLLPHTTTASSTIVRGAHEGAMLRELIGKLGGSSSSMEGLQTSPSLSQQCVGGVEGLVAATKLAGGEVGSNCWTSAANATAVVIQTNVGGGGLTSHCLPPFCADPGFAERAARFSSFSNNRNYVPPFPSDSESGGLSRTRSTSLSAASRLSPRTSSSPALLQVIGNDSTASERDCRISEIQSGKCRGVSGDRSASAATGSNKDNDMSLEQNYAARVDGTLSGTVSNGRDSEVLRSGSTTTSPDASSDRPEEPATCASPGGRSGATDISIKKRKTVTLEERAPNELVGSGSASPHHTRDAEETEEAKAKRLKRGDGLKDKDDMRGRAAEGTNSETSGESSPRPTKDLAKLAAEHPKTDYIHVRARRGQATDSHSLAERVRREKISERMKFLQDLVPGCSKVTGKAMMLDEIINYVQSLQRQVEFLSMKLASVNPQLDFQHEPFLCKEDPHSGSQAMVMGAETISIAYPPLQPQLPRIQLQQGLGFHEEAILRRMSAMPVPTAPIPRVDGFEEMGQRETMWDDGELNSVVQMGFGNSQAMSSQALQCHVSPGQVKVELQQSPITCL